MQALPVSDASNACIAGIVYTRMMHHQNFENLPVSLKEQSVKKNYQ
jgi:hypothetical protein